MTARSTVLRIAVLAIAVCALALVPASFAAKGKPGGGGGSGGSLGVVMVDDANADGAPNYAESMTFNVSSTSEKPYVNVRCYQGTAFVYDGWAAFYAGAWFGQTFILSSTYWAGGAAECTARLVTYSRNGAERTNATMNFSVGA